MPLEVELGQIWLVSAIADDVVHNRSNDILASRRTRDGVRCCPRRCQIICSNSSVQQWDPTGLNQASHSEDASTRSGAQNSQGGLSFGISGEDLQAAYFEGAGERPVDQGFDRLWLANGFDESDVRAALPFGRPQPNRAVSVSR
jgi:hypothetical protein